MSAPATQRGGKGAGTPEAKEAEARVQAHLVRTRLAAVAVGVALAIGAIAAVCALLPGQGVADPSVNYGYVYSGAKSSSTAFARASAGEDQLLIFGSSELSTPASLVPQVPAEVFGSTNYGLQLGYVGEAYDQSLWHAIALGAYSQAGAVDKKAVLVVSPGWFTDGGMDPSTFQTRFSYSLYQQFVDNPLIGEETRAYVRSRLGEMGIDEATLAAAGRDTLLSALDGWVTSATDDLRLRRDLVGVRQKGRAYPAGDVQTPDFAALRAQAAEEGAARSSSNDWGVEDAFWTDQLEPALASAAGSRTDETYQDTPEYDDLDCLLDVCEACGIRPLVVISPVMGPYYDHIGIDAQTREGCYERIRALCSAHDCEMADLSGHEYERYFLYDIVHFGWTGWVDVEQAIYDYGKGV